ncbi:MAG: helix-turn-helix domain-containing protein [Acidimicrobiales bacterium]
MRPYDATGRQDRARQQHLAALDTARAFFLENGYAATTVESIAHATGVSVATIYKTYGGKAGLVRALCQSALEGAGAVPAEERSNALRAVNDPRQVIGGWGRLVGEVSPRISPLLLLLRIAAQTDPDAASLHEELDAARLARMTDNARYLARSGHLRAGVTMRDARDVLWFSTAPELYDLLVTRRRWSVAKYSHFVTDMITGALLSPD